MTTSDAQCLTRPQPVGLFPFPASHLLLPHSSDPRAQAAGAALLEGDLDCGLPDAWLFLAAAGRGDAPAAIRLLPVAGPMAEFNRFVLEPTPDRLAAIELAADPVLVPLARAAAFAHGLVDDASDAPGLDGELRAVVLLTVAAARIERDRLPEAAEALEAAVAAAAGASPLLEAMALVQLSDTVAALAESAGEPPASTDPVASLRRALDLTADTRLPLLRAEIWMKLGVVLQRAGGQGDRRRLLEAITCYQQAIAAGLTEEAAPSAYGQLQNNLGLAYLATPTREASDQLRTGIAVQSFREALRVSDRNRDPEGWASVQMNLANALQYLPSSHPAENLAQAVDAYEEVLQVRTKARDPVAHGRVLLNQANALAHLGIFKPAIEKLAEAMKLLSWYGHDDEAAAARDLLGEIEARQDELRNPAGSER
jgi:tetratricopeptide (TPR) repeat protein